MSNSNIERIVDDWDNGRIARYISHILSTTKPEHLHTELVETVRFAFGEGVIEGRKLEIAALRRAEPLLRA